MHIARTRLLLAALHGLLLAPAAAAETTGWTALAPGVDYAELVSLGTASPVAPASGRFHVVRIDPQRARLRAVMASQATTPADRQPRTAAAFCQRERLVAAINLGMFRDDNVRNVGHAESAGHVNQPRWVDKYKSVLAFAPRRPGLPAAVMVDLDVPGARAKLADYGTVIQNLRLIKGPGQNVWSEPASGPPRRWSEAAVALDRAGRVLFLFSRAPYSMAEFNRRVLALPLNITHAMHVEGGPEASLSLCTRQRRLDRNGSYETGFVEDERVTEQWPIPNVLGVEAAPPAAPTK
ncbi:MAG: phosphodiester glycosidase family protein [Polyangia bacterium]